MKNSLSLMKALSLLAAGLVLIVAGFFIYCHFTRPEYTAPDTSHWQTGDIFFSAGNSWKSDVVRLMGGNGRNLDSSHCGFIVRIDGKPMLVHMSTEKDMITMESIEEYVSNNDVSAIHAMRLVIPVDTMKLKVKLMNLIKEKKPFDSSFDHHDASKYYCTELVIRELQSLGINNFNYLLAKDHVYPQDIETSDVMVAVD